MKIAIVGGGIFGCTIAWTLAKNNHSVDLYEKNKDIFMAASGINQYRLHRGYHYPRSKETILSCLLGEKEFRREYTKCVIDSPHEHYYGITKEGSFSNAKQCFEVWKECGLNYEIVDVDFINKEAFEAIVKVREAIFDHVKLKEICSERFKKYNVNVILNKEIKYEEIKDYDLIVIATYCMNNSLLNQFPKSQKNYQFELIEKLVLKLPEKFKNKSFVVQDGPFTCIDPLGRTGFTLMGNVVHAIHHTNIGKFPEIPEKFKGLLNNGIIKNPKITKIKKFLNAAEKFFPRIKQNAQHIGSMYTIRTVLPYREHDDARPTIVEQINGKIISVFSGKIPTCIDAAKEVLYIANK